jgi:4-hydroxy-tetrahydrodipicolinate reductase
MNISLVGYGRMGKAIEAIAKERGHHISYKIAEENIEELGDINPNNTDVVIEFTAPDAAVNNLRTILKNGVPVVCGTTGWLDELPQIESITNVNNTAFFYASNFSIGVNIFFKLNKILAGIMGNYSQDYDVEMEEIHHIHKLDAPSGTAITLAEDIIKDFTNKSQWSLNKVNNSDDLKIVAKRIEEVPGTHTVNYNSSIDSIEIKHTAHNRTGFALGAVVSAEWLKNKKGVFGMEDMLKL